ncbi:hypothetical protein ABXS75_02755 [Roseburia hominis]
MNYYSIFDMAEDECIDVLQNGNYEEDLIDTYTSDITKRMVFERINRKPPHRQRKISAKKILIIAIAAALLISSSVMAQVYWELWETGGAVKIDDSTRGMVGQEIHHVSGDYVLTQAELEELFGQEVGLIENEDIKVALEEHLAQEIELEENEVVKTVEEGGHIPYSVDVFSTTQKEEHFITPEIICTNNAMAVFTTDDKRGWRLKKGDKLHFTVTLYSGARHVAVVNIVDGELKKEIFEFYGKELSYQYVATKDCYYNVATISASSDTISFHEGTISIDQDHH